MDDGHPLADQDVLRALFLALAALDARAGTRLLGNPVVVFVARPAGIIVYDARVVDHKVARDIHAIGAGHTVAAPGTGDGAQLAVLDPHLVNQSQFSGGQLVDR